MKAFEIIEKPEAWTQGAYSAYRTKDDEVIKYCDSRQANCHCASGAIRKKHRADPTKDNVERNLAVQEDFVKFARYLQTHFLSAYRGSPDEGVILIWNDEPGRTHAEVYSALKECDV